MSDVSTEPPPEAATTSAAGAAEVIAPAVMDCPPPAERVTEPAPDGRAELLSLAAELMRTRSRRLLIEYLRLRRAAG